MSKRKKSQLVLYVAIVSLGIITAALYVRVVHQLPSSLSINEVAFSQSDGVDWIEIYNPTPHNMTLHEMYLSDDLEELTKYQIPAGTDIRAHGFLVIYADNADLDDTLPSANFNISFGETIYLTDRNGSTVVDMLQVVANDEELEDTTIGRFPDGADQLYLLYKPTFSASNTLTTAKGEIQ